MATKLTRYMQKLFGLTDLAANRVAQFGSLAGGSPAFASDPAQVQSQPQFGEGWVEAVMGLNYPAIEDENALDYLWSYQLAYLLQEGVPEYDPTTTYFFGSLVNNGLGVLYVCIDDNAGAGIVGEPITNVVYWDVATPQSGNSLLNSAFDWWQRGTSFAVHGTFGANSFSYTADRWAALNSMDAGALAVMTVSRVAGSLAGSNYALQGAVTTAPTAPASGVQLFHILGDIESLKYSGRNAIFSAKIKALGNITSVALQFVSSTGAGTIAQSIVPLGTTANCTVNSAGFISCSIPATAMGALPSGGFFGVQILANVSSSGHPSDVGNGIVLEQAQMNVGSILATYDRTYNDSGVEFNALARYFEKSYDPNVSPGTSGNFNGASFQTAFLGGTPVAFPTVYYKATKNFTPTVILYNPSTGGTTDPIHDSNATDLTGAVVNNGINGFVPECTASSMGVGNALSTQWTAESELY